MAHVSATELRANLAEYLDKVCDSRAPLHVTRQNAGTVVMVSEEEYEGLMETVHLLKSPANATRLMRAADDLNRGRGVERGLIEPQKTERKRPARKVPARRR